MTRSELKAFLRENFTVDVSEADGSGIFNGGLSKNFFEEDGKYHFRWENEIGYKEICAPVPENDEVSKEYIKGLCQTLEEYIENTHTKEYQRSIADILPEGAGLEQIFNVYMAMNLELRAFQYIIEKKFGLR